MAAALVEGLNRKGNPMHVPQGLVDRWQNAYHHYGQASAAVASQPPGHVGAALNMAKSSWSVAQAWREIALVSGLPWWLVASLDTAAQSFEFQARDWQARANTGVDAGRGAPRVRRGGSR